MEGERGEELEIDGNFICYIFSITTISTALKRARRGNDDDKADNSREP